MKYAQLQIFMLCNIYLLSILTFESLSWEKVSTMIPNMMFNPIVVTIIKNETSKKVIPIAASKSSVIWPSNC